MKTITFKIYEDLLKELDRLAALLGTTRSELIRRAIEEYVKKHLERARPPKWVRL